MTCLHRWSVRSLGWWTFKTMSVGTGTSPPPCCYSSKPNADLLVLELHHTATVNDGKIVYFSSLFCCFLLCLLGFFLGCIYARLSEFANKRNKYSYKCSSIRVSWRVTARKCRQLSVVFVLSPSRSGGVGGAALYLSRHRGTRCLRHESNKCVTCSLLADSEPGLKLPVRGQTLVVGTNQQTVVTLSRLQSFDTRADQECIFINKEKSQ